MTLKYFDRPIAFHRCLVDLTGSVNSALMLSQAIYWSNRTKLKDGWFYKSMKEWQEETGLSRTEQQNSRKTLMSLGFWEEDLRGVPATINFRIDENLFIKSLESKLAGNLQTGLQETCKLDCTKPANQMAGNPQTINTETTTEITSETTTSASGERPSLVGKSEGPEIHPEMGTGEWLKKSWADARLGKWPKCEISSIVRMEGEIGVDTLRQAWLSYLEKGDRFNGGDGYDGLHPYDFHKLLVSKFGHTKNGNGKHKTSEAEMKKLNHEMWERHQREKEEIDDYNRRTV